MGAYWGYSRWIFKQSKFIGSCKHLCADVIFEKLVACLGEF
jgi:hypothetical protein